MARKDLMAFRVAANERKVLKTLAATLERNESDTLRFILREAARARGLLAEQAQPVEPRKAA